MSISRSNSGSGTRGCGGRKAGGVYLCCGLSTQGLSIEHFLIDPVSKLALEPFRAPILLDDTQIEGLKHAVIWVGVEHYRSPMDFIQEVVSKGVSRRIPRNFNFSALTPGMSRMILVHPKAYTEQIVKPHVCPKGLLPEHGATIPCLGAHYRFVQALGSLVTAATGAEKILSVTIGDMTYEVPADQREAPTDLSPGAFLQVPITHVEYQSHGPTDTGPREIRTVDHLGWDTRIIDDPEVWG
ncbi:MAG: hypothetical protein ACYDDA_14575 [Acidiferrobacteraceae bacterium]